MQKQIRNQILNLAQSVFDDAQFNKVVQYLNNNRLTDLRLFLDETTELLSIVSEMDPTNQVLIVQLKLSNQLEDMVLDAYLESVK
jgi:hypothetical protein